ncbi:Tetraacyldisaccharide 4'-kinase [Quillaja saponaria]|uniref:Tetraacyldisaccharide 4'-kinase n=1 Tax=Quillaja saponaria TaxID=32244 RepID=A0AAD7PPU3_QUISA|nr:Tetraacyldisaccharide 4'-kinase [Quillaja saponaria]
MNLNWELRKEKRKTDEGGGCQYSLLVLGTWGGNGNTPMAEFIALWLADSGISPLILTGTLARIRTSKVFGDVLSLQSFGEFGWRVIRQSSVTVVCEDNLDGIRLYF